MSTTPNTRIPIEEVLDPILLGDPVLKQLKYLDEINVDHLKDLGGLTTNEVNARYKTEFLTHMSILDQQGLSREEIADKVGIHQDNVNRNFKDYCLPRVLDRQSGTIRVASLVKQLDVPSNRIYGWYKVTILYQIFEAKQQGMNLKQAAKASELPYQKTRDWFTQYQIKDRLANQDPDQLSAIYTKMSTIMSRQTTKNTKKVSIHPSTRLFCENGRVIQASGLITIPELLKEYYLMFDPQIELIYGRISEVKLVNSNAVTINTMSGGFITVGEDTALISDQDEGLVTIPASLITDDDTLLNCRHYKGITERIPSIFELLHHPPGRPEVAFVFTSSISDTITTRLSNRFDDLKDAANKLDIRYNHGLVERQYRHSELQKIVDVLGYPDINHPDFMDDVKTVSYAIQGGRPIDVDRFKVDTDLVYLMGLIASDGYASQERKAVLGFTNKILPLVELFRSILLRYFPSITTSIRGPNKHQVTHELAINHYPLRMVMYNLNIKGDEEQFDEDTAYLPIFRLPDAYIKAFLRGLFDGDGYVSMDSWKVTIAVFHPQRSKNVQLLLKRLNIDSKVQYTKQKEITPPRNEEASDSDQWNIIIEGKKDIEKFRTKIKPNHPVRGPILDKMVQALKNKTVLASKYNLAPRICSSLFRSIRQDSGVIQNQISSKSSFGSFELGKNRKTISQVREYLDILDQYEPDTMTMQYLHLNNLLKPIYNMDPIRQVIAHQQDQVNSTLTQNTEDLLLNAELHHPTDLIELTISSNLVVDTGLVISGCDEGTELGIAEI